MAPNNPMTTLTVTHQQMADMLPCSRRHLDTMTKQRLVPVIKIGRHRRYNVENVMKALEKLTIKEVG